jgi:intein/homing endonuclease
MKDKGFEIRFRDKTVQIAVNEPIVMSVITQTVYDDVVTLSVGGLIVDTHTSWLYADDLKPGDEIVIEQKEIEQSSEPINTRLHDSGSCCIANDELSPEEKEKMLKLRLERFHALENKLREEGLIE